MELAAFTVAGYRSVRDVRLRLGRVTILVGPNGSGKSNLYKALMLLGAAASGGLARAIADEGGMPSALWAGDRTKGPVRMTIGVELAEFANELALGLIPPTPGGSAFDLDPHVKEERLWFVQGKKRSELLKRDGPSATARDAEGDRAAFPLALSESESALAEIRDPRRFPVLAAVREAILGWRFYHQFRTDAESPLRHPQVGVRTPALAPDGRDLAAAIQTIREGGDRGGLDAAVDRAFPGSTLVIESPRDGRDRFSLALAMPGFRRPFGARELSDGTLHYLALLAALFSPRPAALIALNEPEASIHPDLMEPLAALIARASRSSQVWVTTHEAALAEAVARLVPTETIRLEKVDGATRAVGRGVLG